MNPDRKRLFFHVGTVKTGSTYIQKFLYDNMVLFQDMDVDYLILSPLRLDLPRYANADFLLNAGFDESTVRAEMQRSRCRNILISEEGLAARPDILTHKVFEEFETTVIVYIRAPAELIASWAGENSLPYNFWQEQHGSAAGIVPINMNIANLVEEYRVTLTNFMDALDARPDIRLVVKPYIRGRFLNDSLIDDFISALDLPISAPMRQVIDKERSTVVNEGRTRKYCDISAAAMAAAAAQDIADLGPISEYGYALVDHVYAACKSGDDRKVVETLSDQEMLDIHDVLMPVYERLRARGLDFEGFEAALRPKAVGTNRPPYQALDIEEVQTLVDEYLQKKKAIRAERLRLFNAGLLH